jgi:hypothetical protein
VQGAQKHLEKLKKEMEDLLRLHKDNPNDPDNNLPLPELKQCGVVKRACVVANAHFLPSQIDLDILEGKDQVMELIDGEAEEGDEEEEKEEDEEEEEED